MWSDVIYDIETDGLLDEFTKVHCLVVRDVETGHKLSCTDDPRGRAMGYRPIREGVERLNEADRIYGHNLARFDNPALEVMYPDLIQISREKVFDTLIMTRLRWAHIKSSDYKRAATGKLPSKLIGSQGLEAWGHRFGIAKGDYTDWCEENGIEDPWAEWRPEMQTYCEQDTDVNAEILRRLRKAGLPPAALAIERPLGEYLAQQERNGWPFDLDAALELQAKLVDRKQELEEELQDMFGSWYVPHKEFTPKVNNSRYGYVEGATVTKLKLKHFNPGSRDHIADRLQKIHGWEPKRFTPTGKPKVDETALEGLDFPSADKLLDYLVVDKILGYVVSGNQAWLNHVNTDGRWGGRLTGLPHIHHSVGRVAVTHRHRHSHPNLSQVPSAKKPYGKECRSLFIAPPRWKIVGSDASGLELRCLAHYMAPFDGGEYGKSVLYGDKKDGTDSHSLNAKALGVIRDTAKTWFYAFVYGAGDEKLGKTVGVEEHEIEPLYERNKKDWHGLAGWRKSKNMPVDKKTMSQVFKGKELREKFLTGLPAMGQLMGKVEDTLEERDYLTLPDGRRAYVRSKHAALNTLLQGAGAIICKKWIVTFNERLMDRYGTPHGGGWEHPWAAMGWIHDEVQIAVNTEKADPDEVGQILVDSIRDVGDHFNWNVPLDGEYDIGDSWAETH